MGDILSGSYGKRPIAMSNHVEEVRVGNKFTAVVISDLMSSRAC